MKMLAAFGIVFFLLVLIIPAIVLIDILKHQFESNDKLIWVIIVIFLNFVGAILYLVIGRRQRIIPKN